VRLWIDECLSPTLVDVAQRRCEATCNKHRGLLNAQDEALYAVISQEEWVLATDDDDFLALAMRAGLHPGLIILPQRTRSDQPPMLEAVLDHIDLQSSKAGMPAAPWMTNRVVEYHDEDDTISAGEWPPSSA
jgi:predicted nuclease of predicted toxin-antitoxin system